MLRLMGGAGRVCGMDMGRAAVLQVFWPSEKKSCVAKNIGVMTRESASSFCTRSFMGVMPCGRWEQEKESSSGGPDKLAAVPAINPITAKGDQGLRGPNTSWRSKKRSRDAEKFMKKVWQIHRRSQARVDRLE